MLIRTIGVAIHILCIKKKSVFLKLLIGIMDVLENSFKDKTISFEIAADFFLISQLFICFLQNQSHNIVITPSMKVC